ncbi:hypothetical protein P5G63_06885 [Aeromonas salmonicida]|uniref:hypothetical protein n=1 Tax=Aeromonas salmonicida TaxID=645 RepID=UPI00223FE182|nr:hypothetical protein [Aeromonas salmonicida]MDF8328236.1 hypothetical protein [Aeromonas salmonicida]
MKDIIIIDGNGHALDPMEQREAEQYLIDYLEKNLHANLKQCLNDVTGGKGKATGAYQYNGHAVLHASSGNVQKSVSLFYYDDGGNHHIIAMGEHKTATSYKLNFYGQPAGDFKYKATIIL